MLSFVYGGSASGKSEYAEQIAAELSSIKDVPLVYLATMCASDSESKQRIERHISMRADKPFLTIEASRDIAAVEFPANSIVLLECLSNLLANEMFHKHASFFSVSTLLHDVLQLQEKCSHLVIVSNEVFRDGIVYDTTTTQYLSHLGFLHQQICARADTVTEVVCGIPLHYKKEGLL